VVSGDSARTSRTVQIHGLVVVVLGEAGENTIDQASPDPLSIDAISSPSDQAGSG
jgi:hypothetical protein